MRDYALLSFLYNSGARIQEALDLCPEAISPLTRNGALNYFWTG